MFLPATLDTHRGRWLWWGILSLIGISGTALIVTSVDATSPLPPAPPAKLAPAPNSSSPTSVPSPLSLPLSLTASEPTRIDIPTIDVHAPIEPVGLQANDEVETPPLEKAHLTGWYKLGVTPGEIGSSVILGHVDSWRTGPAVFFSLGALKPGQEIDVTRKDGTIATFVIDGVTSYPKDKFPSWEVYGSNGKPELRLVTCGGTFDTKARSYTSNVVVSATLRSFRIATQVDKERPLRTWIPDRP